MKYLRFFLFLFVFTCLIGFSVMAGGAKEEEAAETEKETTKEAAETIELEVASFTGGFHMLKVTEGIAEEYMKVKDNVTFNVWGGPRVWEKLRPRFAAGNPPDLAGPGWGFDIWSAVYEGEIMPLDDALNSNAYGQDIPWKDTLLEGVLAPEYHDGHYWAVPQYLNVGGWIYDVNFFKEKGLDPPKTWDELLNVSKAFKTDGVAPFSNQGMYPYYAIRYTYIPLAVKAGGIDAYVDAVNLEPGAWKSEGFLKAAQAIKQLVDNGYYQTGHLGMNHTTSQMQVLLHKAAIINCGTWIEAEMAKDIPEDVKLQIMKIPAFEDGEGDYQTQNVSNNPAARWIVPAKGKHPDEAIEFLKFMTSPAMVKMTIEDYQSGAAIMPFKGYEKWVTSDLIKRAADDVANASARYSYTSTVEAWYKPIHEVLQTGIQELFAGDITPEEYVNKVEAAAEKVRNDPDTVKHTYSVK
jgi:N-acetylglucosamine transport system substrate-binding protein